MKKSMQPNAVTVVVPVYGDWDSLAQCIDSLLLNVTSPHQVILVNDVGPDANFLESAILEKISGISNFRYFRNETNLGFVKTCNRAAYELDTTDNDILLLNSDTITTPGFIEEMATVLALSSRHGTVCPRSNNATIASIPLNFKNSGILERDIDYARDIHTSLSGRLPRFSIVPVTPGFCILIRRTLIKNFDLFDEIYGHGYSEENDFCLRINKYGYSSVMANRAFVAHLETKSFTAEQKSALQSTNELIMTKRYPYYEEFVRKYLDFYIDPVDRFADVIAGTKGTTKVLINLHHLSNTYNGTSRNALSLLSYIRDQSSNLHDIEFTVVAGSESSKFHHLDTFGIRVIKSRDIDELFDVGYCPSQIFHAETLQIMNKYCLRIAFSHLDIIAIRSNHLLSQDYQYRTILNDAVTFSDKVISISNFSRDDFGDYFGCTETERPGKFVTVHQGYPDNHTFTGAFSSEIPTTVRTLISIGRYALVFGNDFDHKMVRETLPHLSKCFEEIVVIGPTKLNGIETGNSRVHFVGSGGLSDRAVDELLENAQLVFFPSAYEGFGLPIAEAAKHRKPLVVQRTEGSEEICALYESIIPIGYFNELSEIAPAVSTALSEFESDPYAVGRTLSDYNRDVVQIITELAATEIDDARLRDRWTYLAKVQDYAPAEQIRPFSRVLNHAVIVVRARYLMKFKARFPNQYLRARDLYRRSRLISR
ncbi:glycosyltransferase [Rhodococcus sp. UFZ-B548]|uniref:glycosyltransferase n=1 Tax=Rhodococcus sp. UFZ-B548 TaxID=2742212 RepID=UPI0015F5C31D|nr:glycosyltransferase [Rhodococcus sp. UFZ-B548]